MTVADHSKAIAIGDRSSWGSGTFANLALGSDLNGARRAPENCRTTLRAIRLRSRKDGHPSRVKKRCQLAGTPNSCFFSQSHFIRHKLAVSNALLNWKSLAQRSIASLGPGQVRGSDLSRRTGR
jgi:hypothetical protein